MDWNFAKVLLSLHRSSSIAEAAQSLRMSESTLFRRLSNYEKELGKLFIRDGKTPYSPTVLGQTLLETAEQIESLYGEVSRKIKLSEQLDAHSVSVTAPTSYAYHVLPDVLKKLHTTHPEIRIQLKVTNDPLSLSAHEADIALRVTSAPPGNYIGRNIASVGWSAFCGSSYAGNARARQVSDLAGHPLITGSGKLEAHRAYRWVSQQFGHACVYNADDFVAMAHLAAANLGVAILPDEFKVQGLCRLFPVAEIEANSLWVLKHTDVRHIQRVKIVESAISDIVQQIFQQDKKG